MNQECNIVIFIGKLQIRNTPISNVEEKILPQLRAKSGKLPLV